MCSALKSKHDYIIDHKGNKKAIILSIAEYESLMEDLQDLAVLAERREEPVVSHSDVMEELNRNEFLTSRLD